MQELALNNETIEKIKLEVPELIKSLMKEDLIEIVLYGSCARGDYTEDSDIDIALITKSNRIEAQKYAGDLAAVHQDVDGVTVEDPGIDHAVADAAEHIISINIIRS